LIVLALNEVSGSGLKSGLISFCSVKKSPKITKTFPKLKHNQDPNFCTPNFQKYLVGQISIEILNQDSVMSKVYLRKISKEKL